MTWELFNGDGEPRKVDFPKPPPWRRFPLSDQSTGGRTTFQTTPELVDAINASLHLRRPLLLTGSPGSGKSSVADAIAHELSLGPVLRWNVTSRSTLEDAVYRYDALGRLQHNQREPDSDDIADFLLLGPLGTALQASIPNKPRVLLIDELDKGELDLPGDLLNVFERGEYVIPELRRFAADTVTITSSEISESFEIHKGEIRCRAFPVVVMTSNGEREFPAPFLRRCVRFKIDPPNVEQLTRIVEAHFDSETAEGQQQLIERFAQRLQAGAAARPTLAIDQLLNAVFVLSGPDSPDEAERDKIEKLILRELDKT
jgi:MoxR-like ATPase